jgi:hypothetical protein
VSPVARRPIPKPVTVAQVRALALALPESEEVVTWGTDLTWRVRSKIFAMGGPASPAISVKCSKEEQAELIAAAPDIYQPAAYVGRFGWVSVTLAHVDAGEIGELLIEAWRQTAPKKLVRQYDAEHAG